MITLSNITLFGLSTDKFEQLYSAAMKSLTDIKFGDIVLLNEFSCDVRSYEDYNKFMITDLHLHIKTEYALIIQPDGYILNHKAWSNDFLNYDYVGAPWDEHSEFIKDNRVGNGGFNLRSKRLIELTSKMEYPVGRPEDAFICIDNYHQLMRQGIKFAPVEVAARFSIEGGIWNGEFGFHNYNKTDISKAK